LKQKKPITPYGLFEIFFTADLGQMAADYFTAKTQSSQRFLFFPFGRDTQKEKPTGPAGGWLGFILNVQF